MGILFAISFLRWGGVNTWMLELGQALRARGHSVTLVAPRGHLMLKKAAAAGLATVDHPFGPDLYTAPLWWLLLKRRRIDVVVANTSKEIRTIGAAARLAGLPVAQWVGLASDLKRNTSTTRFERRKIVNRFVAVCASMREEILRRFPHIDSARLIFIRPGKPARPRDKNKTRLQQELGLDAGALNAVICSQLTQGKGHIDLLQAVRLLKESAAFETRRFHLSIFHTGKEKPALEQFVAAHQLGGLVAMRGFCENITELLPAFDLGLLPSHWEGLANNLLEYMTAGLAPIVSDIPGNTEVVRHGKNGLVHRTGDAEDLARQLRTALESTAAVACFQQQAFRDARALFDMEQYVEKMECLFEELRREVA